MSRPRRVVAVALVIVLSGAFQFRAMAQPSWLTPGTSVGKLIMPVCAPSYGDYMAEEAWDEMGECLEDISGGALAAIHNRIQQFENVCSTEANWLYSHNIYEWTGNYATDYEWDAFSTWWGSSDGYIAIHWPYLEDWYILAHEGAHGSSQNSSENFAIGRGNYCTLGLY